MNEKIKQKYTQKAYSNHPKMAFILKKKRYKFQVDLCLEELSEISYSKAVIFAKVRQLDGGAFTDSSKR